MFEKVQRDVRCIFRLLLQRGSINTGSVRGGIACQLASDLQCEELPEWIENDLLTVDLLPRSRFCPKKLQLLTGTNSQATQTPPTTTCTLLDSIGCSPRVSYLTLKYHNIEYEQRDPSCSPALEGQLDPQPRLFRSRTSSVYPSMPRDEELPVFQDFRHDPYTDLPPRNEPNEKFEPAAVIDKATDNLEDLIANIRLSIINHALASQLAMNIFLAPSLKQYNLESHHQDSYFRGKD
ncbi:BgTH12-06605 [Blumeria graminis f. sp. triticale]|uniref:BgTH12-06605 n=1 Tax=Blumeria graminis f. sp. triticale TaxID=1689686 RepID=A0A9W4GDM5_BLUGR|nr:BgTH12-06605 [Blumeria graminis f. sp. triticale]